MVSEAEIGAAILEVSKLRAAEAGGCFNPIDDPQGECADGDCYCTRQCRREAEAALSAAARVRAEANAGEPVAWEWDQLMHDSMGGWEHKIEKYRPSSAVKESDIRNLRPLYTHPAPQPSRAPTSLTDAEKAFLDRVWPRLQNGCYRNHGSIPVEIKGLNFNEFVRDGLCAVLEAADRVRAEANAREAVADEKLPRMAAHPGPLGCGAVEAKWIGDNDRLPYGEIVEILAIDREDPSVPGRRASWVRWWPERRSSPAYRSCDLADLELDDEVLSALMAGRPEQRGCPPFRFDRYINGALMAEGVTIERQSDMQSAMREAARIAPRGPNGEVPVLVLAPPTAGDGDE